MRKEHHEGFGYLPAELSTGFTFPAALLLVSLCTGAQVRADSVAADVSEIAAGVHVRLGRHAPLTRKTVGEIANTGFIVGKTSVVVIDAGGSMAAANALRQAIRRVTSLPVSHLVLTHFHPDHVFGSAAFADVEHVVAHENHARAMLQRGAFYTERFATPFGEDRGDAEVSGLRTPTIEIPVGESLVVDAGDRPLSIRAHRTGHTDNDLSVFDAETGTLWASDLVFAERTPSLDGSLRGWLETMDELSVMPIEQVVPGHGLPGGFERVTAAQRAYLEGLLDETRERLAAGSRLADALSEAETTDSGDWVLFEQQHPTNVTKAWTELEWD